MVGTQSGICTAPSCPVADPAACPATLTPTYTPTIITTTTTSAPVQTPTVQEPGVQETLCVKYTEAVFGEDNADNELTLIETMVNLAVLGDADLSVPDFLAAEGGLAPFVTGAAGNTTNIRMLPVAS
jgi:hypothetical protein